MYGIIDSGADITIMGGGLFQKLATHTHIRKDYKKVDKVPRKYCQQTFHLDGRLDLVLSFNDKNHDYTCIHQV